MGFQVPTPVQEAVITPILQEQCDVVALAQTGTGKTAAFGLPLLEKLRGEPREIKALVLCPTRELAIQITKELKSYAANLPKIAIDVVYGGAGYGDQVRSLKHGVHILVATPGRLLDLLSRGKADISTLEYLVLDEADIMLNMGFKEDLDAILETAPAERRTILLSATMPNEVARIADTYMHEPLNITIGTKNAAAESVEHTYYMVRGSDKYPALKRLVDYNPDMYAIVFCRTKASTQDIADRLISDGYDAEALHGDLSQSQREFVMNKFRRKNLKLLIATDIAARGLDVQDLTHVIHYDLPDEIDMYTHRSGRTGRAGKTGCSYAIVGAREKRRLQHIERVIKRSIKSGDVPGGEDIFQRQLLDFAERLADSPVDVKQLQSFMPAIQEKLEGMDRDELLHKIIGMQFSQMLTYYKGLPDMKPVSEREGPSHGRSRDDRRNQHRNPQSRGQRGGSSRYSGVETGFAGIKINLGKNDGISPPDLIGLVNQTTRNRNIEIGRIKINDSWSSLQVEGEFGQAVSSALDGFSYKGQPIKAGLMSEGEGRSRSGDNRKNSRRAGPPNKGPYKGSNKGPNKGPKKSPKKSGRVLYAVKRSA